MASIELTSLSDPASQPLLPAQNLPTQPASFKKQCCLVTCLTLCFLTTRALYRTNILLSSASTFDSIFLTSFFSFIATCIFTLSTQIELISIHKSLRYHLYLQAILGSFALILAAFAIQFTHYSSAISLLILTPLWNALLSSILTAHRLPLRETLLLLLAISASFLIINPNWFGFQGPSSFSYSNLFGICAGLLSSILLSLTLYFHTSSLSPLIPLIYTHLFTFLVVPYFYIFRNIISTPSLPHFSWLYYFLSAGQGICLFLAFIILHYLPKWTSKLSLLLLLEIPVAVILDCFIFSTEDVSPWTLGLFAGCILLLVVLFRLKF